MKYENIKTVLIEKVDTQSINFLDFINSIGFFSEFDEDDCECINDGIFEATSTYNKIVIGIKMYDNFVRFGIDPSKCFDSINRSSIIIQFPMSKREEHRVYRLIHEIFNTKSDLHKRWVNEAPSSWYGEFYGKNFLT